MLELAFPHLSAAGMSLKDFKRFILKIEVTDECWTWKSSAKTRYGYFNLKGTSTRVNRLAWALSRGSICAVYVCHHCDNTKCVRPDHLFEGTQAENMLDMYAKGRATKHFGDEHWTHKMPERVMRREENGNAKLTEEAVAQLRCAFAEGTTNISALSRRFGIGRTQVYRVLERKSWP